jgi:hypothetical protein
MKTAKMTGGGRVGETKTRGGPEMNAPKLSKCTCHGDGPDVLYYCALHGQAPALAEALAEALNALLDYVPTLEAKGASLAYGHSVIAHARAALLAAGYTGGTK